MSPATTVMSSSVFGAAGERAAPPPDRPHHETAPSERVERLAQRHPAHPEPLGELALRREAVAGPEVAAGDGLGQPVLDLGVGGRPGPIDLGQQTTERPAHDALAARSASLLYALASAGTSVSSGGTTGVNGFFRWAAK